MGSELLQTKLFIPPTRPDLVPRPRLIERLNEGISRKLILICAPAGFGKTTLISNWVAGLDLPVTWISLDKEDNDRTSFLVYLVAALQSIESSICETVQAMLLSPQQPPTESILKELINEVATLYQDFILVFDDYQVIEDHAIDEALTFLLGHIPPVMHMVIISRSDPMLPLSRLRARSQMTELRIEDLRFSTHEATDFLNRVMGLALSEEDVAFLESRTEGWIAGLHLAALSMQDKKDVSNFITEFSGDDRYIVDYLVDEVLAQQPKGTRDFLLQTSILDRMAGPLCDAVTDQESGQELLERLDQANLFIVPLDHRRQWYRYHHLFADLLRQRLRENDQDRIPQLHRRAADWFARQGLNREALHHSLAAKDYQQAVDLLKTLALEILQRGEHTAVSGWINALPENLVTEQPYLCVIHAWALFLSGQLEATEARLSDAEEALANLGRGNDADTENIRGYIHCHRAFLTFVKGDLAQTISYARQALEQLPPEATAIRTQTTLLLGAGYRYQGKLQAAQDIFTEAVAIGQKTGGNYTAVMSFLNLAELYTDQGHLHQAKSIYEKAIQFAKHHTGRPDMPFTGYAYVGLGRILHQWNELDDAYHYIIRGITLGRDWNVPEMLALSCIDLAHIHWALGNDEQACEALQEAKRIFANHSPWGSDRIAAHQAQLDLARGEVESAECWAQACKLNIDDDLEFHREEEYLTLARVFIVQTRFEQALSLLGRVHQIAQAAGKMQSVLETLVLQALALSAQGRTEQAFIKLEEAFVIGEPENYVRIFVDEGDPMETLLHEAETRNIALEYVRKLLAAFETDHVQMETPSAPALIEPLSERELEVLRLLKTELSGPEIADHLMIALSTLRTHTQNIYSKLGVRNRRAAVRVAEEYHLR